MRQWRSFGTRLLVRVDDGPWSEIADFNRGKDAAIAAIALNALHLLTLQDPVPKSLALLVEEAKRLL